MIAPPAGTCGCRGRPGAGAEQGRSGVLRAAHFTAGRCVQLSMQQPVTLQGPFHTDCGTASCNPCCYHLRRPQLTCVKRSAEAQVMPYRLPSMTAISVPVRPWPPQLRKQGTRSPGRSGGNVRGLGVRQDPQVCLNRSCGCYPSPFLQQLHPRHGYPASTQPSTAPVDVHALAAQDARAAIVGEAGHSGIAGHVAIQDGQVQEVQLVLRWEAGEMGLAVGLDGLLCPAPSWWPGEGR